MNHRYRKLPVEVEAFQMTADRCWDKGVWPEWLHAAWRLWRGETGAFFNDETLPYGRLYISTLEGDLRVEWGDWIIRGVKGELYPCKPDVFEATYEPVGSDT